MHADASMLVSVDTVYHYSLTAKAETQNLASHKQGKHLFPAYSSHPHIAMD